MRESVVIHPQLPTGLPDLEPELLPELNAHIETLRLLISEQDAGFLPFDQYMQQCLYAPNWGYYTAGSTKFGSELPTGDFTTAPELSPLFGQSLAQQVKQILDQCVEAGHAPVILEFGAGTGALAASLIDSLANQYANLEYCILELSPSLRARQQQRLGADSQADNNSYRGVKLRWLDQLPEHFAGCIVANEVLDAMPVYWLRRQGTEIHQYGVQFAPHTQGPVPFVLRTQPITGEVARVANERFPQIDGYSSELNLAAEAWVHALGQWLDFGAALIIDYGFPQHEYYHPQRGQGTLMCHFRHHAHDQPLIYPGLQDITAHVDFTALADAALEAQLEVYGYSSQANFLLNCGLPQLLQAQQQQLQDNSPNDEQYNRQWAQIVGASQTLLSESEMGELFKVIALGKGLTPPLIGFLRGDRRDRL